MRSLLAVAVVVLVIDSARADDPVRVGSLVRVDVKNGQKQVAAKVGDLVEFEIRFPVVPNQMVTDLKMEFTGKGLTKVGTVTVPQLSPEGKPIVGVSAIAGFARADGPGEMTVTIVPRLANGTEGEQVEFKVGVAKK